MSREQRAALQLLAGAVMISFSGVFVKLVQVGPTAAGVYRMLFGGIGLGVVALFSGQRLAASLRLYVLMVLCGLAFAADLYVWHRSIHFVGPGLATILGNFQVFALALAGFVFLKERPRLKLVAAIPLAMLGLFLIVGINWDDLSRSYRAGVWLGLATAVFYAVYILLLRRIQRLNPDNPAHLTVISLATCAFLALLAWMEGESLAIGDPASCMWLVLYGIMAQVLGWVFISKALPEIRISLAGLLLLLQPCLAFIWDMLLFARPTGVADLAGAALTLGAIYLGSTSRR